MRGARGVKQLNSETTKISETIKINFVPFDTMRIFLQRVRAKVSNTVEFLFTPQA